MQTKRKYAASGVSKKLKKIFGDRTKTIEVKERTVQDAWEFINELNKVYQDTKTNSLQFR